MFCSFALQSTVIEPYKLAQVSVLLIRSNYLRRLLTNSFEILKRVIASEHPFAFYETSRFDNAMQTLLQCRKVSTALSAAVTLDIVANLCLFEQCCQHTKNILQLRVGRTTPATPLKRAHGC